MAEDMKRTKAASPKRAPMPPGTRVKFLRDGSERIAAVLPRGGPGCSGLFLLFWALFWNAITWGGTVAAWTSDQPGIWIARLFLLSFIAIGAAAFVGAWWLLWGRTSLAMDRDNLLVRREAPGFKWDKRYPLADVESISVQEVFKENDVPRMGISIKLKPRKTPLGLGTSLNEQEMQWLVGELSEFRETARSGRQWP